MRLSPGALLELTPSLLRLAHKPETTTSDFTVLAGASEVFDAVGKLTGVAGSSRFVVNDPAVAGIHATVLAALASRIRIR